MPALYTLWNTRFEKRWTVGSDDFVLPTILAISVRLVGFVFVVGILVYLYVAPLGCEDETLMTPPWLYGTLFAVLLLEFAVMINDAIIMSKSCSGRIDHSRELDPEEVMFDASTNSRWPDPDSGSPRRKIKRFLFSHVLLFLLEIILSALFGYACWSPALTHQLLKCDEFKGPIYFARAVAVTWWLVIIISCVLWLIYLDPIGVCSSGLIDQMDFLDEVDEIPDPKERDLFKFHRGSIGSRRIRRRLQTICCCLGLTGHESRGLALEDAAKAIHTIFDDVDLVASDLAAGLILLNRDQKRKLRNGKSLVSKFKKRTFQEMEKMRPKFIPEGYDKEGNCLKEISHLPFTELDGYLLLDDLLHFCHYAVGVYGWPLYVYGHTLTGCCALTALTCCKCYCCQLAPKARNGDIIADNVCFCGFASVQLQSPNHSLKEADIKHITFKNDYFECPYLLCVDHAMHAVVDVLTDITVSLKKLTEDDIGENIEEAYVHSGMYRTAMGIKEQLLNENNPILRTTCKSHNLFRLVIVGHSLGAGVASILAVLLRKQFPDLVCYAFSPPGCVFSFPLAKYSREFITSVVIGNDMVPRLSMRALHYMKREIEYLLKRCKKPKHQVLFQPRACDTIFHHCGYKTEDPTVCIEDFEDRLFEQNSANTDDEIFIPQAPVLPPRPHLKRADSIASWGCCGDKGISRFGDVHTLVKKITNFEKVPAFAPGDILHIAIEQKSKSCCWPSCNPLEVETSWMKSEDLGVIIADRGMLEDHMPTRVMDALKAYHREVTSENREWFTEERIKDRRKKMRFFENRNDMELRDTDQLVQGCVEADSTGFDEVDGAGENVDGREDVDCENSMAEVNDEVNVYDKEEVVEVCGREKVDSMLQGVSVNEASSTEETIC